MSGQRGGFCEGFAAVTTDVRPLSTVRGSVLFQVYQLHKAPPTFPTAVRPDAAFSVGDIMPRQIRPSGKTPSAQRAGKRALAKVISSVLQEVGAGAELMATVQTTVWLLPGVSSEMLH